MKIENEMSPENNPENNTNSNDEALVYRNADEAGTVRLGAVLASVLPDGSVVGLIGTLGAGKTRLVTAVAEHCDIDPKLVGSPTFVLLREYRGTRAVYHFDTYRLKDEDEFMEIGPDEYFDGNGLSFVEWSNRVESVMPRQRLDIVFEIVDATHRNFRFVPHGERFGQIAREIMAQLL